MTLAPDEARETLHTLAQVERQSTQAFSYERASPHLILWGICWAFGYGLTGGWPQHAALIWTAVVAIGVTGNALIAVRFGARRSGGLAPDFYWRFVVLTLTMFAFIGASLAVLAPVRGEQIGAFVPLVVAAGYAILSVWRGPRFLLAGSILAALTLVGFFLLRQHFALWMAAVGGGALVLAGLWMRKV